MELNEFQNRPNNKVQDADFYPRSSHLCKSNLQRRKNICTFATTNRNTEVSIDTIGTMRARIALDDY